MNLVIEALSRGKALVGHRGIPSKELENTLQSVERAMQAGADIVEVDIQKTRDGVLVLSHDESLERTFGESINIRQASWEEISKVRKDQYRVARLEEVLELVGGKVGLFLEIKHPEDCLAVAKLIEEKRAKDWTALISFHIEPLEEVKGRLITGLVYSKPPGMIPEAKKSGCSIVLPKYMLATQKAVDFAHKLRLFVVAWTVNDPNKALELFDRGVDGIATDDLDAIKKTLMV